MIQRCVIITSGPEGELAMTGPKWKLNVDIEQLASSLVVILVVIDRNIPLHHNHHIEAGRA